MMASNSQTSKRGGEPELLHSTFESDPLLLQNRCINDCSDYAGEQDYASAKHCCYNTDTQTSIKGPRDVAFLLSFLRKAKKGWERGGWINKVRENYLGRIDRNPVFLPGTSLLTQGKLQHSSKTAEAEAQRQRTKLFIKTQDWKELTSVIVLQKIILLNFLAQKNQEQLPLEEREKKGGGNQGQRNKVTG